MTETYAPPAFVGAAPSSMDTPPSTWKVTVIWEAALAAITLGFAVYANLSDDRLWRGVGSQAAVLMVIALGLDLGIRGGAINLAVGPLAGACAITTANLADGNDVLVAAATVIVVATVVGIGVGSAAVGLRAPTWAATLLAGGLASAVMFSTQEIVRVDTDLRPPWLVLAVVLAVLLSVIAAVPMRTLVWNAGSASRDRAAQRTFAVAATCVAAMAVSFALVASGGAINAIVLGAAYPQDAGYLFVAFVAVVVGGTSVRGGRGGVTGVISASLLLTMIDRWSRFKGWAPWKVYVIFAVLGLLALLGSTLIDSWLRRQPKAATAAGAPLPPPPPPFDAPPR
jgi:ribose/xylose/arabinose/galactoside ABC-type transport system permease subunit